MKFAVCQASDDAVGNLDASGCNADGTEAKAGPSQQRHEGTNSDDRRKASEVMASRPDRIHNTIG